MSRPSSIRCWYSNPQPLKHELSPITTRPGLPPNFHGYEPIIVEKVYLHVRSIFRVRGFATSQWCSFRKYTTA